MITGVMPKRGFQQEEYKKKLIVFNTCRNTSLILDNLARPFSGF
jgi:hypothetical protein